MRPLVRAIVTELEGRRFIVLDVYDDQGRRVDEVIRELRVGSDFDDSIIDICEGHRLPYFDFETDSESLWKRVYPITGVVCRLVPSYGLADLYRIMNPSNPHWPMIYELYIGNTLPTEEKEKRERGTLSRVWTCVERFIKKLFKRGNEQ